MSASVRFQVECRLTKQGEVLFVTGGQELLGSWVAAKAVPLATTADTFPQWTSEPLVLPVGQEVEYKFFIQRSNHVGEAKWEQFPGNRKVTPEANALVTATSTWSSLAGTKTVSEARLPLKSAPAEDEANGEPNTPAAADVSRLAEKIEAREPMRKNFSQSLLALDVDLEGETPVEKVPTPAAAELPTPMRRGVPLQHISSFSALTEMAAAAEKEEVRKTRTVKSSYEAHNTNVPVVIVTSEIAPFSKTGGLGLVAASYSYEFARKGHRTMAVSPKYKHFDNLSYVGEAKVVVGGREEVVKYFHRFEGCGEDGLGCDHIFVEHQSIQREGGLYNGDDGREYSDNLFRFTLLSLAAMEAPLILKLNGSAYGDKVLFLANDWQAGLVPLYMCHKYRPNNCYVQSRVIYVVHNLGYQGQYPNVKACHFFGIDQKAAIDVEFGDCINLTKGALICADRVLTVSPNYTKEIQTAAGGFRLESLVRAKGDALRLGGILNGIDDCWNPETDVNVARRYSVETFETGKAANKAALQKQLGLHEDANSVLIGFVGRLTWQKGVDVMVQIVSWLMEDTGNGVTGRAQLIMMGNGEKQYADTLRSAEGAYPGRVCGYVGFDPKIEHQMMAGCDLFLMPSRYEPCGLPQMYSQRYGTLPIVTATGGLVDSVKDVAEGTDKGTGFHMSHLAADKMREIVYKAAELYLKFPAEFRQMQRTAMLQDFYWPQAMDEYEKAIDQTLYDQPVVR